MSKLFTPVLALALFTLFASAPALAGGRDSGGNGDSKILQAGDEFGDNRDINKSDRCLEEAFTDDDVRRCKTADNEDFQ